MTENPDYIIVYGTLRPTFANPFAQFLCQNSLQAGDATFPGLLLDLGDYPGALYQPSATTVVYGTVYDIGLHKQSVLTYLDDYENVGAGFDQPNEYARVVIPVHYQASLIDCWAYLYNWPADGKAVIESGSYIDFCRQR